jgi:SpoVK/Ycf46/Vps4 family AAA+-type ATPase
VLADWGLGARLGGGGVAALLSGPPGTGKTACACAIAAELGVDVYAVDASAIASKWIGETERNLAALFDAAAASHAMLLFDEADALFGKRTEQRSSNDRHANAETNYLLHRLEQHDAPCVLTTNHADNLDPAFLRRFALHLRFAPPDAADRAALWRAMLPKAAPVAADVDAAALARRFELPGGHIRNAVLRAAFLAADRGVAIDHALLERAARVEYEAMGRIAIG